MTKLGGIADQLSIACERARCLYLAIDNGVHAPNEYDQAALAGLAAHVHELIADVGVDLQNACAELKEAPVSHLPPGEVVPFEVVKAGPEAG